MPDDNHRHVEVEVTISNVQGLHARPVMRFVDLAGQFASRIKVCKGKQSVDGKSPMEMMLLEGTQGTVLKIVADGEDAPQAVEALAGLVNGKFGED
jgi:phosphocarrier protein